MKKFSDLIIDGVKLSALNLPSLCDIDDDIRDFVIKQGESYLNYSFPELPLTLYEEFSKTGNRVNYERPYFEKRRALSALVLAYLVNGKGIEKIKEGLDSILCEVSWCIPAHNNYVRDTMPLSVPDPARPVVDLFAAETGATLSLASVLVEALDEELKARIRREVEKRIITPYLNEKFWWKGCGEEEMCNWSPWCTENVLLSAFLNPQGDETERLVLKNALYTLDCFTKDYAEDGCTSEGADYYHHAALALFDSMEIIDNVADNLVISFYDENKIKNMALYTLNLSLGNGYSFNFSDCSAKPIRAGVLEYLFAKRIKNSKLEAFAINSIKEESLSESLYSDDISLYRRYIALSILSQLLKLKEQKLKIGDIHYESVGIITSHKGKYSLAVKCGSNGDSHNHNDTGSFTLYKNGKPFIIDVGVETYTAKTFSKDRYDIWTMRSDYHNTVNFKDQVELAGKHYRASNVELERGEADIILMDLDEAFENVFLLNRCLALENSGLAVTDLTYTDGAYAVFMLASEPQIDGKRVKTGEGTLTFDSDRISVECITFDDEKLNRVWTDKKVYRLKVEFTESLVTRIV
jgi:Heparinase II/III-like protein.